MFISLLRKVLTVDHSAAESTVTGSAWLLSALFTPLSRCCGSRSQSDFEPHLELVILNFLNYTDPCFSFWKPKDSKIGFVCFSLDFKFWCKLAFILVLNILNFIFIALGFYSGSFFFTLLFWVICFILLSLN